MNRLIQHEQDNNIFDCHFKWADEQIDNAENKKYQEHMRNLFSNNVVFVKSAEELRDTIEKIGQISYACVFGPSIAYNLPSNFYEPFILFSENISDHIELFIEQPKMMSIIDQCNPELLQQYSQFITSQTFLESIFKPKMTVQSPQYSSSDSSACFKFLLINELFKNQMEKVTEEKVMNELKSLIGDQAFREMDKLVQAKQQQLNCQFNLFQKILFYQTTNFLFNKFNQALSQENYHQIKYSLQLLFQGYSIQNQKPSNKQRLGPQKYFYQGISFDENQKATYDETINILKNQKVIYCNTLTSIYKHQQNVKQFVFKKYKILLEIELDHQNPHPFIEFTNPFPIKSDDFISLYNESEVLLFPQFCFKLVKADMIQENQYLIEIKQVQNNNDFSMELEEDKRSQFWNDAIDRHLKNRLNIMTTFLQNRIKFVIKHFQLINTNHDLHQVVQFETYNYFDELMILLRYVFRENAINEYKNMIKQQLEFNLAITEYSLLHWLSTINKITKIVIEDFISALKSCCKIQDSKTQLANLWETFEYNQNRGVQRGLFGGIIESLFGKFDFDIMFTQLQYTIIKNGFVEQFGRPPSISLKHVSVKAKTVVLLVHSKNVIHYKAWRTPNSGWHGIGRYIGPRFDHKELTFHLFGLLEFQIDEETIVEDLLSQDQPRYEIICYAKKKIKLNHFE